MYQRLWLTMWQTREDLAIDTDFSQLHEISRHATHSKETLLVTSDSMNAMRQRHLEFHRHSKDARWTATQQHISFQGQLIGNLNLRAQANQERLQSEITLVSPSNSIN
jgi:hypothetical protein